jgi:hypothetical protein
LAKSRCLTQNVYTPEFCARPYSAYVREQGLRGAKQAMNVRFGVDPSILDRIHHQTGDSECPALNSATSCMP